MIEKLYVKVNNDEEFKKATLVFLNYGYFWPNIDTIFPKININYPIYILGIKYQHSKYRIGYTKDENSLIRNKLTLTSLDYFLKTY